MSFNSNLINKLSDNKSDNNLGDCKLDHNKLDNNLEDNKLNKSDNLNLGDNNLNNNKLDDNNLKDNNPPNSDSINNLSSNDQLNISNKSSNDDSSLNNIKLFSDAGIYGLCGLASVLFYELFPDETNKNFCKDTITALLAHLNLSSNQVKNSMYAFLEGECGNNLDDFVNLLKKEDVLKNNGSVALIEALILFSIRDGIYDARLRVLILKIADLFNIPRPLVNLHEESVIEMLSNESPTQSDEELKEKSKRLRNKKIKKYLLIGSGTILGGTVLGLTGGLIAPAFSLAAATILGAGSATILGSTTSIAIIGSLFGVAGAGLAGHKMKKRVGDIEEFAFEVLNEGKELCVTIAVSGWISDKGDNAFTNPWKCLQNTREQYCVRYESNYLLELGKALDYFLGFAVSMGVQEALKFTILSGIMAAIAWPATLMTFSSVIDNPWSVCVRRSAEVGRHLAEVLLSREQGKRPVSLIGFSLGARVIYFCLLELAQRENSEGIVQDAILLGAPVSGSLEYWRKFSKVVSGRIVNGYCRGDWLLKFLYRTTNASIKIAGLDAVDWKDRRMENFDLSDIVNGHLDYYRKLPEVLKKIGIEINENELNTSNGLMKKSATGLPASNDYSNALININPRMCISLQNLDRKSKNEDDKLDNKSINFSRSLSLEDLKIKNKKSKIRISSTCSDFKKESSSKNSNSSLSSNKLINNSSNETINKVNNQINKKSQSSNRSRLSRFNILSRFSSRKTENIEEEETNDKIENNILKDDLSKMNDLVITDEIKLNNQLIKDNILKDKKLKEEINDKIKNELKDEVNDLKNEFTDKMELNEEQLNKINQLELNLDKLDSTINKQIKRNESEFLQLNVESLNLKNNCLKRI